jgi:hypothetical protein
VRYRVDGVLRQIANPPLQLANRLASRLKVMSQMDISENVSLKMVVSNLSSQKLKPLIFV